MDIQERVKTFDERVSRVQRKIIVIGSDEHLDLINKIKQPIDRLTHNFASLNEYLHESLSEISDEIVRGLIPMMELLRTSLHNYKQKLINQKINFIIQASFNEFCAELEDYEEILHDLTKIRLGDNKIGSLLDELKDL